MIEVIPALLSPTQHARGPDEAARGGDSGEGHHRMRAHPIRTERGPEICLDTPDLLKRARFDLSRHKPVHLRVSGSAMRPSIEDGDVVTVEPVAAQAVRAGDIVLYQSLRDTALIHRV